MVLRRERFGALRQKATFQVNQKDSLDYVVDNQTDSEIRVGPLQIPVAAGTSISLGNPNYPADVSDRIQIPAGATGEVHVYGNYLVIPNDNPVLVPDNTRC